MGTLSYRTAGESHGKAMIALVEGIPAGVHVDVDFINSELRRRQGGYGRGARQKIETDSIELLSGVRRGQSIGSPITMMIDNRDARLEEAPPVTRPRPGHADLAGSIKWLTTDCRETLERASARETAARVAAGALARCLLRRFAIESFGFVRSIGEAKANVSFDTTIDELVRRRDASDVYCPDETASRQMHEQIRHAKENGDTVGGVVEAHVFGCPPGLGSCAQYDQKLDGRLAQAVMSIQAFKAVEIGLGQEMAIRFGSQVHDEIAYFRDLQNSSTLGFLRGANNAGGIEGGMTNGQPIVVRGAMKPISTLMRAMKSVDLNTKQPMDATHERSDICAVPAASVIVENVVAFEVARALLEKFGGDSLIETRANFENFLAIARKLPLDGTQTERRS